MRERIKTLLNHAGLSVYRLAKDNGLVERTIGNQINGTTTISADTICAILRSIPEASAEYLIRGNGPMYREEHAPESVDINVDTINGGFAYATGNSQANITTAANQNALQARIAELEERIQEQRELLNFYRQK